MADPIKDTSNPETQDSDNTNTIFDNDSTTLEDSLAAQFLEKQEDPAEEEAEVASDETEAEEAEQETTEEVTDAEDEEETEAEAEEEAEPELSDKHQAALDKRISRELKKLRKEHDERMSKLDETIKANETPTDALAQVKTTMDKSVLEKIEADAEKTIDFVEEIDSDDYEYNSERDEKTVKLGEELYSRQQILAMKKNAKAAIKQAGKRRKLIDQTETVNNEIHKAYPTLLDNSSDERLAVDRVLNETPSLREDPQGLLKAIYMVVGEQTLNAKPAAKKKKKATPKAPSLPESNPTPKKSAATAKKSVNADIMTQEGGDVDSLVSAYLSNH